MSSHLSHPRSTAPRRFSGRRARFLLVWIGFLGGSFAAAFALYRMHVTVQRELLERGRGTLVQERSQVQARVESRARELQISTMKTLAAFHIEGLAHALRQWDTSDKTILGTFIWNAPNGFSVSSTVPLVPPNQSDIPALWQEFRTWRAGHAKASASDLKTVGEYETAQFRLLDNPAFPVNELGYQAENLEILTYEGGTADPWAGWAGHRDDVESPWIIWYQPGPHAPVRGCFVDHSGLLTRLREELTDATLARITVVANRTLPAGSHTLDRVSLSPWLPGYSLIADYGDLFVAKQSDARLTALATALLLALVLAGAVSLSLRSRRTAAQAERRTTFVTQVSHELRTPLTSIRIFADMLSAPGLPEEKRTKYAGSISRESQRLGDLIERLLTFSTLERGKHAPSIEPIDVVDVVRETFDELERTLAASKMKMEIAPPTEPMIAATDRSTLKQALLNLADNALKYAAESKALHVSVSKDGSSIRVRITDQGPGIPRSLGERIFEPFFQGGETLTDKPPGVGLGLSIARGLLRGAGGDLVLLPSERGAVFEIRLPMFSP